MERCPVCGCEKKGKYWCNNCYAVFVCPNAQCGAKVSKHSAGECPVCGLEFKPYIERRKKYRRCPKCGRRQGLADPQCRFCRYWFLCPTCGHKVPSTSTLTCPRCGTPLR